jgi:LemA protein
MTAASIAVLALALAALWLGLAYGALVRTRRQVDEAWAGVGRQLGRRHELVPALVEGLRGRSGIDRERLREIGAARAAAVEADEPGAIERAEARLTGALAGVAALADERLRAALAAVEADLDEARRTYNAGVRRYNVRTRRFPALLFARQLAFEPRAPFEVERVRLAQ